MLFDWHQYFLNFEKGNKECDVYLTYQICTQYV